MQRQEQSKPQTQQPPYLFYSNKCQHCRQLIDLIKQNGELIKVIKFVNIHEQQIPKGITSVPTILYNNQLLIGTDTFKWVHFQKSLHYQNQNLNNEAKENKVQEVKMEGPIPVSCEGGLCLTEIVDPSEISQAYVSSNYQELNQNNRQNGTEGIDINEANNQDNMARKKDSAGGMSQQFQQLQKMRGYENKGGSNNNNSGDF